MSKVDYSYQTKLIDKVCKALSYKKKVVLAACPGAGKTVMAIKIIKKLFKERGVSKILILTHGQTVLRSQWAERMSEFAPELKYHEITGSKAKVSGNAEIIIAIPQSSKKIKAFSKKLDLIIIDEAHHFYHAKMVKKLISNTHPDKVLLLTGTPSAYINKPDYQVIGITIQDLLDKGVISDPNIKIIKSTYPITLKDYNEDQTIKKDVTLSTKDTIATFRNVLESLEAKLGKNPGKTMIICHSQKQAKTVYEYLSPKHSSLISMSDISHKSEAIETFKKDKAVTFLVVVNRGILGFDFPELMNVVDLTMSLHVNRLFQMLCRVIRRPPRKDKKKMYFKISSEDMLRYCYLTMSFVVSLSDPKYYFSYEDGIKPEGKLKLPRAFLDSIKDTTHGNKSKHNVNLPELTTFRDIKKLSDGTLSTVAETDFNTVKRLLGMKVFEHWDFDKAMAAMSKYKNRTEFAKNCMSAYLLILKLAPEELEKVFPLKNIRWGKDPERIKEICRNAKSLEDLHKAGLYHWVIRSKYKYLINHLRKNEDSHNVDACCFPNAKKFSWIKDFRAKKKSCYQAIQYKKRLNELTFLKRKKVLYQLTMKDVQKIKKRSDAIGLVDACKEYGMLSVTPYYTAVKKSKV